MIRIGTRGSQLALWQANRVADRLRETLDTEVELITIKTTGDLNQTAPLSEIGGKGAFVKEIEVALLESRVDVAVHSAKDLPSELAEGTVLAAFPEREDPHDALITGKSTGAVSLEALPSGARVGTGSLRRRSQLLSVRPDLRFSDIRGNVDTRLRKLDDGLFDAIVLACAGLRRLGLGERITQVLDAQIVLPAVCQGILGIQTRQDSLADTIRSAIDNRDVRLQAEAERGFLARFGGDCQIPVAAHCRLEDTELRLDSRVISLDGRTTVARKAAMSLAGDDSDFERAAELGRALGDTILEDGGREILRAIRGN